MLGGVAVVVLLLVASPSLCNPPSRDLDWNRPVDLWLEFAKRGLVHGNMRDIPVDDIEEHFVCNLGFFKIRGRFAARQGSIGDITTLSRRANVTVARAGAVTKVTTRLGWDSLVLTFGHFRLDMASVHITGDLASKIGANCLEITLAFENVDGECVTTVDDLRVVEFGDFDLKVNGLGSFNFLASTVGLMVADNNRGDMMENTARKLKDFVTTALAEGYRCEEEAALLGLPLN